MLGSIFAILSAASFALNNATVRRGVVSGTPIQAMAVSVPLGVVCFLPLTLLTRELFRLPQFPTTAVAWMAGLGVLHFVFGRYCNFRANSVAGVNLTAPVVQLQVIVTLVLAVVILREPCSVLQAIGGCLILIGSFITQRQPARVRPATAAGAAPVGTTKPAMPHRNSDPPRRRSTTQPPLMEASQSQAVGCSGNRPCVLYMGDSRAGQNALES